MTTSFTTMRGNRALLMTTIYFSSAVALALVAVSAKAQQSVSLTSSPPVAAVEVNAAPVPLYVPAAPVPAPVVMETPEDEWKPALKVGQATQGLLALQSSGLAASTVARPIPGDVAGRSYQRYIKSFEYAIPERFGATVKSAGSASGN